MECFNSGYTVKIKFLSKTATLTTQCDRTETMYQNEAVYTYRGRCTNIGKTAIPKLVTRT